MTSGQSKRKRGVVLTPTGRQKLQEAIAVWEEDNFGKKLPIEELSDRTKLDAGTVAKVLEHRYRNISFNHKVCRGAAFGYSSCNLAQLFDRMPCPDTRILNTVPAF